MDRGFMEHYFDVTFNDAIGELGSDRYLKSLNAHEISIVEQKESTAILIRFVSKLRCFFAE